ncbi:MAG: Lrp/AsnC ligand binding domain-containing protein [Rhodospirillaceae bacterium]|nr:Lrp/AsnC ligand binding domain-containing protein [Rhodospirillaceae bacterium]
MALDAIDLKLLNALQRNGRATNPELSAIVNLSPTACFHRVRQLQDNGYIVGYTAVLDPAKLGSAMLVFVEIVLDRTTPAVFEEFANAVRKRTEILECHMVAGGFDYLIKARVADMDSYRHFLGETLTRLPGVRETHTYAVIEEVKVEIAFPLPRATALKKSEAGMTDGERGKKRAAKRRGSRAGR